MSNPNYGEMTITDGSNTLYVYGTINENGDFYSSFEDKPVAGDDVVLYGGLKTYNGKPEMGRSVLISFTHNEPEVDLDSYEEMSVLESRNAEKGTKVNLTGVVAFVTYANGFIPNGFYLVDDTGSIYVYGSQTAQQVSVGNTVTVVGEKTYYINSDEANNASKYGYNGACQIQSPTLLNNDKGNNSFNKDWILNSTVKDIIEDDMNKITSNIFKVNALIKKVPGAGFTNYYINDIDGTTGSYVYTACNGNDFSWLDEFDGKICTVYLSVINCKSTLSGIIPRFIPILVEDNNYSFNIEDACEYAIKYHVETQFKEEYSADPALELISNVSSELLNISNVNVEYSSSNTSVINFDNTNGIVMHVVNSGTAVVTLKATYNEFSFTKEITITANLEEVSDYITVKQAIDSVDGSIVKVKGVVVASAVNQPAFYLADDEGIIAVRCSLDTLSQIDLGNTIVVEGTKKHHKKIETGNYVGQCVIDDASLVINLYGDDFPSKDYYDSSKTLSDIYDFDENIDYTTQVFVVEGVVKFIDGGYSKTIKIQSEDGKVAVSLYCSSSETQYGWLKEFADQLVSIELIPCNWNGKNYYACCVLSVSDGTKTVINSLNFN